MLRRMPIKYRSQPKKRDRGPKLELFVIDQDSMNGWIAEEMSKAPLLYESNPLVIKPNNRLAQLVAEAELPKLRADFKKSGLQVEVPVRQYGEVVYGCF